MHAAIYKIGAIAVPLSILFGPEALQYRIQASGARALFIEPGKISDIIEAMGSDDLNKVSLPDLENIILSPHLSTLTQHDAIMSSEEQSHAFDLKGLLQFRKTTNRKHMNFFTMGEIIENGSKQHIMEETTID
jgi:acyl-coenzyme A synthetase/AMP-(fatty) acid ligase